MLRNTTTWLSEAGQKQLQGQAAKPELIFTKPIIVCKASNFKGSLHENHYEMKT